MNIEAYKIKNKDGLFSSGGQYPKWSKRGKTWSNKQSISSHLRQFCSDHKYFAEIDGEKIFKDNQRDISYADRNLYKTIKGWWNEIPEDWIIVKLSENGIEEYLAKSIKPETKYEI